MEIPINVPDTAEMVTVKVYYKGPCGTDLVRVVILEGEELEEYREEKEDV